MERGLAVAQRGWEDRRRVMAIEVSSFEDDNENALMVTDDDCTHLRM